MTAVFDPLRQVANAVLYEGYALYPYCAAAGKNRLRRQFGVVAPRDWCERGGSESSWLQTECLVEPGEGARLMGVLRFLQLQRRSVERFDGEGFHSIKSLDVDGSLFTAWDEGVEQEVEFALDLVAGRERVVPFDIAAGRAFAPIATRAGVLAGHFVRERSPIEGTIRVVVEHVPAISLLLRLHVRVDNVTPCAALREARDQALIASLSGAHLLLAVNDAGFISLVDAPEWARAAVDGCSNVRTWPVLGGAPGERRLALASPVILCDHPQVTPESRADLYDATEIDEILTLRTMTLTDEERREARATFARR